MYIHTQFKATVYRYVSTYVHKVCICVCRNAIACTHIHNTHTHMVRPCEHGMQQGCPQSQSPPSTLLVSASVFSMSSLTFFPLLIIVTLYGLAAPKLKLLDYKLCSILPVVLFFVGVGTTLLLLLVDN